MPPLTIKSPGFLSMLRSWIEAREIYRASWEGGPIDKDPNAYAVVFRPFLTPFEREARKRGGPVAVEPWLRGTLAHSPDACDLRLHEADWHGIRDQVDRPGVEGIGANTMATRTRTTSNQERHASIQRVCTVFEEVRFE